MKNKRTRGSTKSCTMVSACTALIVFLLAGCAVGPDYVKPREDLPVMWLGEKAGGPPAKAPEQLASWWRLFGDPMLTSLVERGVTSNLDVKIASERIRQSRAILRQVSGGLYPTLDANARYERSSSHGPDSGSQAGASSGSSNFYQAGFDASWELDLFGRVRRGVEAAEAEVGASREDLNGVLVTLTGDIGMNYVTLRGLQEQLRITRENLYLQEKSAQITQKRYDAGFASALDVSNARALSATTRAQIPGLERDISQTIYALDLLLGAFPGELADELAQPKPLPEVPSEVPSGMPSQLLERRPDIRKSGESLHAATARIGVAKADLFPRFFLNGAASIQATDLTSWSNSVARLWSIGPSVSLNLFNGGITRARVEERRSLADQALIEYKKTILTALNEVESAWVAFDKEEERSRSLEVAVDNNRRSVDLASRLYVEGQGEFLNVLDAERSLYSAEAALVQSRTQTATHLVSLFKALGGGWEGKDTPQGSGPPSH